MRENGRQLWVWRDLKESKESEKFELKRKETNCDYYEEQRIYRTVPFWVFLERERERDKVKVSFC